MRQWFIAAAALALAGCYAAPDAQPFNASVAATPFDPALGVGRVAPELHASHVTGDGPQTIAAARGKIVVVDFFASWCLPCKRSFPGYERLVEEFPDEVAVFAVSVDRADQVESRLAAFVGPAGAKFPVLWDQDGGVSAAYHPTGMPTAFIIGRDGLIRSVHVGYEDREDLRIESDVRLMLGK